MTSSTSSHEPPSYSHAHVTGGLFPAFLPLVAKTRPTDGTEGKEPAHKSQKMRFLLGPALCVQEVGTCLSLGALERGTPV